MDLSFDVRGHLKPYKRNTLSFEDFEEDFEEYFVLNFDVDSKRHLIFENYKRYIKDFQTSITDNFTQWINGSFVTEKRNPNDIDFVTLLDYQIVAKHRKLLDDTFLNSNSLKKYHLDAYALEIYPEAHKNYFFTKSDLLYWNDWFSKSEMKKSKKRFPKGYVEITFTEKTQIA